MGRWLSRIKPVPRHEEKPSDTEVFRLQSVFDAMEDVVWILDNDHRILQANKSTSALFDVDPETIVGMQCWNIVHQTSSPIPECPILRMRNSLSREKMIMQVGDKWYQVTVDPLKNRSGGLEGAVHIIRDITERMVHEEELRIAKEKAEESDHLKSAFLANMSHEIRTPMNGIIGLSSMVEDPDIGSEEKQRFLRIIRDNSNQLLQIINDLIDISKIEAGQVEVHEKEICLNTLLDSLEEFYRPLAERQNLALKVAKGVESVSCCIITDDTKLRQVFENLISNALKFCNQGGIEIRYSILDDLVEFSVSDTGIGITEEQGEIVFDRFRQAELSTSRQYGGTGLGLSISKSFVEILGGTMWFDSVPGKGTTFFFTIPYKTVGRDIREDQAEETFSLPREGVTVLVVEDEMANFEYLEVVLRRIHVKILHAQTAEEAWALFNEHPEISLVLMDIKLPDKSGYEVAKEMHAVRNNLPIVAQTAYAFSSEREKALKAGCVDYLSKPIRKELLLKLVGKYLSLPAVDS